MRIAAYQFPVCGKIGTNMRVIRDTVEEASYHNIDLLVFPECAITGYPPRDIPDAAAVDARAEAAARSELQALANETGIAIVAGSITAEQGNFYNRAWMFQAGQRAEYYDKRALWGWDRDNFAMGKQQGIFTVKDMKIGLRICFEVRFPEYFRELYRQETDLDVVLFYDVSDTDDTTRYGVIKSHLLTRAIENVTPLLSVDAIAPFQTAPTCLIDRSGNVLAERDRNREGFIICDIEKGPLSFGERGRKEISDALLRSSAPCSVARSCD